MKILFTMTALVVLVTGATQRVRADQLVFGAYLSGPAESPPNNSAGTGFATVTLDTVANTLRVQITFSGLTSGTTASHIHSATAVAGTGTAGVATTTPTFAGFPLGVTSGNYDNTLNLLDAMSYNPAFITANGGTVATAEAALIAGIISGRAYLNIHTANFGGGEIRGFLVPIPEPATILLLGTGLSGLLFKLRRNRRI